MKLFIKKGTTSKLVHIFLQDSSSTVGAGLTGLTSGSTGLVCYRARQDDGNAGATQLTLSAGTRGTWSSGGFVEKDSTNMPGIYELGLDNAGIASGVNDVVYMLKGATNLAPLAFEIQLVDFDPQAADANGFLKVDVEDWKGTAVASPATAGIPDINIKNINNVAATSVTTVNANIGTTQPINFTGTAASALVKGDTIDWNSTAVAAPATAGIPEVNVKNMNNVSAASITTINANQGTTQPVNFTGTAGAALVKSDVTDIAGVAVNTASAQLGVNVVTNSDKTGYSLTTAEENAIADALLNRDMGVGTDSGSATGHTGRTVRQALRVLRNKWSISGTTQTVTKEDDATTSWSQTVTGTPGANPITSTQPA